MLRTGLLGRFAPSAVDNACGRTAPPTGLPTAPALRPQAPQAAATSLRDNLNTAFTEGPFLPLPSLTARNTPPTGAPSGGAIQGWGEIVTPTESSASRSEPALCTARPMKPDRVFLPPKSPQKAFRRIFRAKSTPTPTPNPTKPAWRLCTAPALPSASRHFAKPLWIVLSRKQGMRGRTSATHEPGGLKPQRGVISPQGGGT